MEIDPRGPRTAALMRYSPYGVLYRTLVRPRLGPPRELESEAPPLESSRLLTPSRAAG